MEKMIPGSILPLQESFVSNRLGWTCTRKASLHTPRGINALEITTSFQARVALISRPRLHHYMTIDGILYVIESFTCSEK